MWYHAPCNIVVIVVDRAAGRKTRQGLDVRIFFQVMSVAIGKRNRIRFAEAMIEACREKVLPGLVIKESAICFELIH